ncbi:MAG: hypothetical protein FJW35_09280 [Acidobacteria bacterium]|nr:hypothetical protein [Acidobacteriota bacterium]
MKAILLATAIVALLAWAVYEFYQNPRVQGLVSGPPPAAPSKPLPRSEPAAGRKERASPPKPVRSTVQEKTEAAEMPQPSPPQNQTPNAVVSRVLIQILAAKKLADGISIGTTDDAVIVAGIVDTEEMRRRILEIVDKAREARRIEARDLIVRK